MCSTATPPSARRRISARVGLTTTTADSGATGIEFAPARHRYTEIGTSTHDRRQWLTGSFCRRSQRQAHLRCSWPHRRPEARKPAPARPAARPAPAGCSHRTTRLSRVASWTGSAASRWDRGATLFTRIPLSPSCAQARRKVGTGRLGGRIRCQSRTSPARVRARGHHVPEDKIRQRHRRLWTLVAEAISSGRSGGYRTDVTGPG